MKVFIHYEEPAAEALHQTLKITLPKKWITGPVRNLIDTFLEQYNKKHPENALEAGEVHLENDSREEIPYDALVIDKLSDRTDLYVKFGAGTVKATVGRPATSSAKASAAPAAPVDPNGLKTCKRFGCGKKYYERDNVEGCCSYHVKPPIFHETVKYWSCCPTKKAYDWDSFMEIRGCETGTHTDVKQGEAIALGGCDVRGTTGTSNALKTVEAFNKELDGADDETMLSHAEATFTALGVDKGMFRAAVDKLKKDHKGDVAAVKEDLAFELSQTLNTIVGIGSGPPPPSADDDVL